MHSEEAATNGLALDSTHLTVEARTVPEGSVPVRVYRSPLEAPAAVLIFAHGGGFSWGTLDDYDQICRNLAVGTISTVISVDYRLAPQNPFPAGFDDVYQASLWTAANLGELGASGARLIAAGDSAGACLAAGVAQRAAAERSIPFAGQLLLYPMLEYYDRTPLEFFTLADRFHPSFEAIRGAWDAYLGGPGVGLPRYSVPPRSSDLSGLPPAFVAVAENDPLRFEATSYAVAMRKAGNRVEDRQYEGVAHGFMGEQPDAPQVQEALADIAAWIEQL